MTLSLLNYIVTFIAKEGPKCHAPLFLRDVPPSPFSVSSIVFYLEGFPCSVLI